MMRGTLRRIGGRRTIAAVALVLGAAAAFSPPASAALVGNASPGRGFHESFRVEGSFEFENFCGIDGMGVLETWVADVGLSAVERGSDGFAYVIQHIEEPGIFTNQANGKTVPRVIKSNQKDLKVTHNGDGTLTILAMGMGTEVAYGANGKAIYRNPGQSRFEFLFDHGGTPTDPSDDELISAERVKGSTGRTDDFCAAVAPALT